MKWKEEETLGSTYVTASVGHWEANQVGFVVNGECIGRRLIEQIDVV